MFPLGMVVFPFQVAGLVVFESRYRQLLEDVAESQTFGTCLISRGSEVGGGDERTNVGTLVRVVDQCTLPTGEQLLRVEGGPRIGIRQWLEDAPYPRAEVEFLDTSPDIEEQALEALTSAVRAVRALQSEIEMDGCATGPMELATNTEKRAWQLCAYAPLNALDQFKVLSSPSMAARVAMVAQICCERYGDYERLLTVDLPNVE
jgi:Lon protease-like protein